MHKLTLLLTQLNTTKAIKKTEVELNFLDKFCKNLDFRTNRRNDQTNRYSSCGWTRISLPDRPLNCCEVVK